MAQQPNMSFTESFQLCLRAGKMLWEKNRNYFISTFLSTALGAIAPYVTVWLSARIIAELAGGRDPSVLTRWVIITLAVEALLALAAGLTLRWKNVESLALRPAGDHIYAEKMLDLEYPDVDRQAVYDLYSQIRQRDNWQGWGILYIRTIYEQAVTAVFQTLGGVALSVTLFVRMVPADSPLAFLNSPLSVLVMLALMLLISLASAACSGKRNSYYTHMQEDALYGNRLFNFWCNEIGGDRKRAPDLRMYNQMEKVGTTYFKDDHTFDVHSRIAGEARGIMGFWAALAGAVSVVLTGAVYLFVCLKALGGAFGVGEVTQYVSAITGLFLGISQILHVLNLMQLNADSLTTCFEFLDIPHKMYKGSLTTEKRSDRQYEIEFKDVSFKYPGSDTWALRHVNLSFKVGSRLAVVGQNGSGKTTAMTSISPSSRSSSRTLSSFRCRSGRTSRGRWTTTGNGRNSASRTPAIPAPSRRGWTPTSIRTSTRTGSTSRAARRRRSPSPAPSIRTPRLLSSTNRPPPSTPSPRRRFTVNLTTSPATGRPSISATGSPPASSATKSPFSTAGRWCRRAAMSPFSPTRRAGTPSSGTPRPSTTPRRKREGCFETVEKQVFRPGNIRTACLPAVGTCPD